MKSFLSSTSKKLVVTVIAMTLIVLREYFDLSPEQIEALYVLAGGYLVGQGISDHGKGAALVAVAKKGVK